MPQDKRILKYEEIKFRMELPYEIKLKMSKERITEYIEHYGEDNVVLCFSGGLDSTIALHFIREYCGYKNVKAISVVGIECKQNIKLITETKNVEYVPLRYTHSEVIKKFGIPIVSKRVSKVISAFQNPSTKNERMRNLALTGITSQGKSAPSYKLAKKWMFLTECPYPISSKCCYYMKETPLDAYAKKKGYSVIVATMAEESKSRMDGYAQQGTCNVFGKLGKSTPFAFWTRQDILRYKVENDVKISEAYGDVVQKEDGTYETTGANRTGCPICLFGMQFEDYPNRFQRMYYEDNKMWKRVLIDYGFKDILDFMIENGHIEYEYYPVEVPIEERELKRSFDKSVAEKHRDKLTEQIEKAKKDNDQDKVKSLTKEYKELDREVKRIQKRLKTVV